eukprot:5348222-Pleurochrysis_carterae.AAC.1
MATTAAALDGVSTPTVHRSLGRQTCLAARGACGRSRLVAALCAAECEPRARMWGVLEVATPVRGKVAPSGCSDHGPRRPLSSLSLRGTCALGVADASRRGLARVIGHHI